MSPPNGPCSEVNYQLLSQKTKHESSLLRSKIFSRSLLRPPSRPIFISDSPVLVLRPQSRLEGPFALLAEAAVAVGGVGDVGEGAVVVLVAVVAQSGERDRWRLLPQNPKTIFMPYLTADEEFSLPTAVAISISRSRSKSSSCGCFSPWGLLADWEC